MYHSRALGDTAYFAFHAVDIKAHGYFLFLCICRHYPLGGKLAVRAQPFYKLGNSVRYRCNIKALTYNTCRGDNYILGGYIQLIRYKNAHFFGYLNSVCIAGVCVSAVADNSLRTSVREMAFSYCKRCALYKICGIYGGCVCFTFTVYKRKVFFCFVFSYSAMYSVRGKSLCGTYSALNNIHF